MPLKKKFKPELEAAIQAYFDAQGMGFPANSRRETFLELQRCSVKTRHNGIKGFCIFDGILIFHWQDGRTSLHSRQKPNILITESFKKGTEYAATFESWKRTAFHQAIIKIINEKPSETVVPPEWKPKC